MKTNILITRFFGIVLGIFALAPLSAALGGSLVIDGDLNVQNNFTLSGSSTGSGTSTIVSGLTVSYNDGTSGTNASITQIATRPLATWNWQRSTSSGSSTNVMQLDAANRLILTGTNPTQQLVLDPNVTSGSSSLLTQQVADNRYVRNDGTGNISISGTSSLILSDGTRISDSNSLKSVMATGTAATISGSISVNQVNGLPPVAVTGSYGSLYGAPTCVSAFSNDRGYVTTTGSVAFAQNCGTAAALSAGGTIQVSQVQGIDPVAMGNNLDFSRIANVPANLFAIANSGTASNIAFSGTTTIAGLNNIIGTTKLTGKTVVTGTFDPLSQAVIAAGTNQLLIPQQGDLPMGTYTVGTLPQ